MIEWDALRVVLAVHRSGSMSAAAELLRVDRATVIRRLDSLETKLKSKLFDRRPDGCTLTAAGRNIIGLVEGVEQAMTALAHRVEGEDGRSAGLVKLAGPEFILSTIIAPALATLRTMHPDLSLDLHTEFSGIDLIRGEADIVLRFDRPASEAVVARKVGTLAVVLCASPDYLARAGVPAGGNLAGHELLVLEGPLGRIPAMGWLLSQIYDVRVAMRASDLAPLLAAARAGAGIACLPAIAVTAGSGLVAVPPGVVGRCDIFLATHRDLRTRARVRTVFDFVVRLIGNNAADLSGAGIETLAAEGRVEA
jgi:DNA-binding transcriptional LysR family regulator